VAVLLALFTAVTYGVGDYSGGRASRLASALSVTATSHLLGLAGLTVAALLTGADHVRSLDLLLGAAAGLFGFIGIVLLYRGLADASMAVVSPVSAVVAAIVPVVAGLLSGERPGAIAIVGIVVALVAITLVTHAGPIGNVSRDAVLIAVGAGIGFGVFFVFVGAVSEDAGLWPLVTGRLVSATIAAIAATIAGRGIVPPGPAIFFTLGAGAFDVFANIAFLLATRHGLLTVVAVLASLYPAVTVLLAMVVDGERISRAQGAGLALAVTAITFCAI
jgi:drug/metabolite transporter (DMT)-like permease